MRIKEKHIRNLRWTPWLVFVYVFFGFYLAIDKGFENVGKTITVHIKVGQNFPEKLQQRVNLGDYAFETGTEGEMKWKPQSFKESLFLWTLVDRDPKVDLFDLVYVFLVNCVLCWMLFDVKSANVFSWKIVLGLRIICGSILVYGYKDIFLYEFSNNFLFNVTAGQFTSAHKFKLSTLPLLATVLFSSLPYFFARGRQIQKEQDLTI